MSRTNTTKLGIGIALLVSFIIVLVIFFMPVFEGKNGLDYLDNLYNSISKGSAYYIPKVQHQVEDHGSKDVTLNLKMADAATAAAVEPIFTKAGITTAVESNTLMVRTAIWRRSVSSVWPTPTTPITTAMKRSKPSTA